MNELADSTGLGLADVLAVLWMISLGGAGLLWVLLRRMARREGSAAPGQRQRRRRTGPSPHGPGPRSSEESRARADDLLDDARDIMNDDDRVKLPDSWTDELDDALRRDDP